MSRGLQSARLPGGEPFVSGGLGGCGLSGRGSVVGGNYSVLLNSSIRVIELARNPCKFIIAARMQGVVREDWPWRSG